MKKRAISCLIILCLLFPAMMPTISALAVDSQAPIIDAESLSVSEETATVGDVVTIAVDVTDNIAIDRIHISFWNLDSEEQYHGMMVYDINSGMFKTDFVVSQYAPAGTWTVRSIMAYDTTGNVAMFDSFDDTYSFEVTGTSEPIVIDTEDIAIDKETVSLGETVTISVKIESDNIENASFDLNHETSGKGLQFLELSYDENTDRYTYSLTIDNSIPSGSWQMGFLTATDEYGFSIAEWAGNKKVGFEVTGTTADAEAPIIDNTTLHISDYEIESGETSIVSVKITDNDELDRISLTIRNEETLKLVSDPDNMTFNSETGMYEFVFVADNSIPSGHWKLCSIMAHDVTGNLNLQGYYSWDYYILVKGENDHVWETDEAVEATCTQTGLTEGSSCSVCGTVHVAQEIIQKKPHDFSDISKRTCANCRESNPNYVAPHTHTVVIDYAVNATCTSTGLTRGSHCRSCGEVLVEQQVTEKLPHDFRNTSSRTCANCNAINPYYVSALPTYEVAPTPVEPVVTPFDDIEKGAWYEEAVNFVYSNGIMVGTAANRFDPNSTASRAMIITMLARLSGIGTEGGNTWYEKAIDWATANGVTDGTNPNSSITREQLITMLWRFAGEPSSSGNLYGFVDTELVNVWAEQAMSWAIENGIISGRGNNDLVPQGNATRAEVAKMFMSFLRV